jgi:hypothetical protein
VPEVALRCADRPLQVLVAGHNVATFDEILVRYERASMSRVRRVRYVSYDSPADLRARVERAQLVITNLPNVEQWARNAGARVVSLDPNQSSEASVDLGGTFDYQTTDAPPVRMPQGAPWSAGPTLKVDAPLQIG